MTTTTWEEFGQRVAEFITAAEALDGALRQLWRACGIAAREKIAAEAAAEAEVDAQLAARGSALVSTASGAEHISNMALRVVVRCEQAARKAAWAATAAYPGDVLELPKPFVPFENDALIYEIGQTMLADAIRAFDTAAARRQGASA